jgi:hypothetical protein
MRPQARPVSKPIATPSVTATVVVAPPPAGATAVRNMATIMAVRLAVALADRSIPPESIVIATARPSKPIVLLWSNIELMLSELRNTSGRRTPRVTAISPAATTNTVRRKSKDRRALMTIDRGLRRDRRKERRAALSIDVEPGEEGRSPRSTSRLPPPSASTRVFPG